MDKLLGEKNKALGGSRSSTVPRNGSGVQALKLAPHFLFYETNECREPATRSERRCSHHLKMSAARRQPIQKEQ
jgi:hypothetical protein